mmetsp:Transcript_37074/g.85688  ORF Transcript_37074/g.85688 Transcript_37074/m.85688 type:complete len:112 (-) Transcript_37074:754-1089(-)
MELGPGVVQIGPTPTPIAARRAVLTAIVTTANAALQTLLRALAAVKALDRSDAAQIGATPTPIAARRAVLMAIVTTASAALQTSLRALAAVKAATQTQVGTKTGCWSFCSW